MPNPAVIAIRVRNTLEKEMLIEAQPTQFFTEPHYNGFPAILVRLAVVDVGELEVLLLNAWRCQAPPALVKKFDSQTSMHITAVADVTELPLACAVAQSRNSDILK